MSKFDELMSAIAEYKESVENVDGDDVVTEKVDTDKVIGIASIVAVVAAIIALITKIIKDNEVKNIIKNTKEIKELVERINTCQKNLKELKSKLKTLSSHYFSKAMEYNDYARTFGRRTISYTTYTYIPDVVNGGFTQVPSVNVKPNENFDPAKAKKYSKLANEMNEIYNDIRSIIKEIKSEYKLLKSYMKQIKSECRKFKYVSDETYEKIVENCSRVEGEIEDAMSGLDELFDSKSFKESEEGETLLTESEIVSLITESSESGDITDEENDFLFSLL